MHRKKQTTLDWLKAEAAASLRCLLQKEGIETWWLEGPVARSSASEIFRVNCAGHKSLALKMCRDSATGKPSPEIARRGFGSLQRLHALALTTATLACPRPIGVIEEAGIVLMEWVPGRPLSHFLPRAGETDAVRAGEQTGEWLAALQRSSRSLRPLSDVGRMLDQIPERRSDLVSRAAVLLRKTAASTFADPVAWSYGYGDFKPSNVMTDGERLIGIDPEMAYEGPALADLAHFLNHLAALPLLRARLGLHQKIAAAIERGYRNAGMEISVPQLAWLRLYNALRLLDLHDNWSRPPRSWVARLILRRLITELAWEVGRLSDAPRRTAVPASGVRAFSP